MGQKRGNSDKTERRHGHCESTGRVIKAIAIASPDTVDRRRLSQTGNIAGKNMPQTVDRTKIKYYEYLDPWG